MSPTSGKTQKGGEYNRRRTRGRPVRNLRNASVGAAFFLAKWVRADGRVGSRGPDRIGEYKNKNKKKTGRAVSSFHGWFASRPRAKFTLLMG